eukprot:CAMPEP_0197255888 /NCGR_PEP_ID=MMETSP1429-20130617/73512_1 /TAXON_ID=49237 /ORGANISM="Chaetoceros  sp., Strain UNC1202" /LENGTH=70 /DNA_ID=CAMNT_0042719297 /DNA_START=190 /DNA_END=399 /DNA_ORIENTATION=-
MRRGVVTTWEEQTPKGKSAKKEVDGARMWTVENCRKKCKEGLEDVITIKSEVLACIAVPVLEAMVAEKTA